jgi:hypothetical protein
MAMQGPIPVDFGFVFPHGAFIRGEVEPVRDFDKSTKDNQVQARDKGTGERQGPAPDLRQVHRGPGGRREQADQRCARRVI